MPRVAYVIDDKSPLIAYDSTWLPGTAQDDPFATDYYLGTFTTNNVTDGSVSFNFNGTAIWIYGANRPNHGSYTVQVDSATYSGFNGAGNNLFQQSLFNVSSLSQGMHTLKLTNTATGSLYVDIDMIVWQSQVGNTSDQLVSEIVQDTDPRFQYQEPAWSATSGSSNINFGLFNNGSGHLTQTYDASVTFTFTAISLFGTSGPSNGMYSVQLDGGQSVQYSASNDYPTNYGVMIYHADNLGSGSHQLVLTNLPATSGESLCIDYAQLWTVANATSAGNPSSNTNVQPNKLSSGAIAGIVIAVAAAILSAGVALLFYRRWKAAMATQQDHYRAITPQQRSLVPATVASTGFSSSLEVRNNTSVLRNDTSTLDDSGGVRPPPRLRSTMDPPIVEDYPYRIAPDSGNSQSLMDSLSSPSQIAVDESSARRPLPGAPGGGMSLSDEFPKLAGPRRPQSILSADHGSIAVSEALPNYTQATGNAATTNGL